MQLLAHEEVKEELGFAPHHLQFKHTIPLEMGTMGTTDIMELVYTTIET